MTSLIGSCAGSFSASCLSSLLSQESGDFRHTGKWASPSADSVLMLAPFLVALWTADSSPSAARFLDGYVITLFTIQSLVMVFPQDMHKRYYGIRFGLPILFGVIYAAVSWYYGLEELTDSAFWILSFSGSIGLGLVFAVCLSDLGFSLNTTLRDKLDSIMDEQNLRVTVKVMMAAVSLLPLFFGVRQELLFGYMHVLLILAIIALSIIASSQQKGSIVSAALCVYSIVAVHVGILPMESAVVFAVLYNSFALNRSRKDTEMLPDLPLLDDAAIPAPMSSEETVNIRFKYFCHNLILLSFFSREDGFRYEPFFLSSTLACAWTLVAPLVLTHRYFPV